MSTSLVLRVCKSDFTSYDRFQWPSEVGADVIAHDWKAIAECGNGLHGWLYGDGDYSSADYWREPDAKWMVLEVQTNEIIELDGKCKFPRATIRFIGTKEDAAKFIRENEPRAKMIIGENLIVGYKESVVVGAFGTAIAGERGTATAGNFGTATAGNFGTATAGNFGTATAGNFGTATAGNFGTATAGNYGTATAGNFGKASAGEYGEIHIKYIDMEANRYRTKIGYVGENGIEPNVFYKLDENHEFVKA